MSKTKTPNIFKLNSKKKIYHLFSIPPCAQDPYYDFSKHYEYGFLHKCKNKEVDFLSLDQIKATFVTEKISEKDRPIVKHKKDSIWIKKAQRFLHKCIVKLLRETPYFHSTIKGSSYATNGRSHANGENKFMFVVDISGYFQGINKQRVIKGSKIFFVWTEMLPIFMRPWLQLRKILIAKRWY